MENFTDKVVAICTQAGSKIVLAILIYIIGSIVIKKILSLLGKSKTVDKLDPTVKSFALNFAKIALYAVLIISILAAECGKAGQVTEEDLPGFLVLRAAEAKLYQPVAAEVFHFFWSGFH